MDLGIPMKVKIQSDSSTGNSLTDRLGAGPRTNHTDTLHFGEQERVQDGDPSIKKVLTAKNCADVGTKPVSASLLLTMDPTVHSVGSSRCRGCRTENRKLFKLVADIETGAKLSETIVTVEE